ncbi:hypothetical protein [Kribbella sp. DT2]|uniref:hypothetical protein n=1 Tax=Kribbella sp. DT2 TaxID=3393427 RepID=UPI003CE7624F
MTDPTSPGAVPPGRGGAAVPAGAAPTPPPDPTGADLSSRIAELTRAVPGVADLHGGVFGEVATYLPGGRVSGVRIRPDHTEVHVTVFWDHPVRATADAVRTTLEALVGTPVLVTVEDVVHPTKENQ